MMLVANIYAMITSGSKNHGNAKSEKELMRAQKIAIIGNSGGGKTELARKIGKLCQISVTHVDSIQFLPGMKIRPHKESIQALEEIQNSATWIIDGYGPLDILEKRLALAELIVFIDYPIWRHYFWCTKRQIKNLWSPRAELPLGTNELTWEHTRKLYKSLWQVHSKMRPELLRILAREKLAPKLIRITSLAELRNFQNGYADLNQQSQ